MAENPPMCNCPGCQAHEREVSLRARLAAVEALCDERALLDKWVSVRDLRAAARGETNAND